MEAPVLPADPVFARGRTDVDGDNIFEHLRGMLDAFRNRQYVVGIKRDRSRGKIETPGAFQKKNDFFMIMAVRPSHRALLGFEACKREIVAACDFTLVLSAHI